MATTSIIPAHISSGQSIASCIKDKIDYAKNPEKTEAGEFVSSYACSPDMADQEFLLYRNAYIANTGRHIDSEIVAYQLLQSFVRGEVTAEQANKIGYQLAERLTGGEFAFLVATHTNTECIHSHIIISAVSLDCTHKYRNRIRSFEDVERISDELCRANHLSVIEEPQNKKLPYNKWLGNDAPLTNRDALRIMIDSALRLQPDGFDALMQLLEDAGCWIKRGAHIAIKPPNATRYFRLDSLGVNYSEAALRAALAGEHVHIPKIPRGKYTDKQVALMVDIEAKMREGKGRGYQVWAERNNISAISKTMIYLKENHIGSYESLCEMIHTKTTARNELKDRMKHAQARMKEISEQKKAITTYRRTKDVYTQYRESGWSQSFYNEHAKAIENHKKAQTVYSKAGGNLPTLAELSEEYDRLLAQKREDSEALDPIQAELNNLWHIKTNLDIIKDDEYPEQNRDQRKKQKIR